MIDETRNSEACMHDTSNDTTTRAPDTENGADGYAVVILDKKGHAYHPLPDRGAVTIGRADTVALRIDRPWISRAHAVLHLGPPLMIENCGAQNGVRVDDVALTAHERRELRPGNVVLLGATMILVQRRNVGDAALPALGLEDFLLRVDQECGRAAKLGLGVEVVAVAADAAVEWDVRAALASTHSITMMAVQPRGPFLVASLGKRMRARSPEPPLARRIEESLRTRGVAARVDGASFPDDGSMARELVEVSESRARKRTSTTPPPAHDLHQEVSALERQRVSDALAACGGNQSAAARMLGIARNTLIARMKEFGLGRALSIAG
jgi:hypothetical protein